VGIRALGNENPHFKKTIAEKALKSLAKAQKEWGKTFITREKGLLERRQVGQLGARQLVAGQEIQRGKKKLSVGKTGDLRVVIKIGEEALTAGVDSETGGG